MTTEATIVARILTAVVGSGIAAHDKRRLALRLHHHLHKLGEIEADAVRLRDEAEARAA